MARISIRDLQAMKAKGEKIVMATAYDYTSAQIVEAAGLPAILVGDSLGMVVLGYENTLPVTLEDILHHTRAVVRGTRRALVIADLPFMSYEASQEQALLNAGRLLKEAGAQAVKLEGGRRVAATVRALVEAGIPVMGHIGLTPQSVYQLGGFRARGKTIEEASQLVEDALALQEAGAFAIVLETMPAELAGFITEKLNIPTIGIGAGPECDGQIQVFHDLLGLYTDFVPKHTRRYLQASELMSQALRQFLEDVQAGKFPAPPETISAGPELLRELEQRFAHLTGKHRQT